QIVNLRPGRAYNPPKRKPTKGLPTSRWLRRLGVRAQLVEYVKPKRRPVWMSAEDFAALEDTVTVRELRYQTKQRGLRTGAVNLGTHLLGSPTDTGGGCGAL